MVNKAPADKFYGRREISLLVETSVQSLFPIPSPVESLPSTSKNPNPIPPISTWVAYILYRTALPNPTIFHALHILRRVSTLYDFAPSPSSPFSHLVHYRLVLSAIILATTYHMDDAYSNKSWAIASKNLFTLGEINEMELEMLECLDFRIGEDGVAPIVEILESYEREFNQWEEAVKNGGLPDSPLKAIDDYNSNLGEALSKQTSSSSDSSTSSTVFSTPPSKTSSLETSIASPQPEPKRSIKEKCSLLTSKQSIWNRFSKVSKCPQQAGNPLGNLVSVN